MSLEATDRRLSLAMRRIVDRLSAEAVLGPEQLAAALADDVSFDDVSPFVRFEDVAYARSLIYRNDRFELRLICWRAGQASSVHGHGDAACAFRVVRGTATEIVLGERDRVWPPGAIVEERGPRVHQVMNFGPDPLITLHAYSPPLPVDAPSPRSGHQVVIIGGGFSGTAVAYHLLKHGGSDLRINVVERGPWVGRGVAFGVESDVFRLNVPASRMSIDPSSPEDFARFADAPGDAFVSRSLYGRYVMSELASAVRKSPAKLRVFRDEVVDVTDTAVELRSGLRLDADVVVLATGLTRQVDPRWNARVVDAWDECGLATLPRDASLLLLGAGLSAIDVTAWLHARRFEGRVTLLSRRGLLPLSHVEPGPVAPLSREELASAPTTLRPLIEWARERVRVRTSAGEPWQYAIDAIRPHAPALFRSLSPRDRVRFVRHVRPYWDAHRHRAPADALAIIEDWQRKGVLTRVAGRIASTRETEAGLEVELSRRDGSTTTERFDAIVRCLGPSLQGGPGASSLVRTLVDSGLVRASEGDLGIETDVEGRVVDARGQSSERLFALGWMRRATDWESTSVPEIAVHAEELARRILAR